MTCAWIMLLSLLTSGVADDGSYRRLNAAALKKFESTAGKSQAGRAIAVEIPGASIAPDNLVAVEGRQELVSFKVKGVTYVCDRADPYVAQTQRKIARDGKAKILVKGRVIDWRHDRTRGHALSIDSVQILRAGRPPAKNPKSVPTEARRAKDVKPKPPARAIGRESAAQVSWPAEADT